MTEKGLIFDIMKYALHDGPGIRTTVFLKGCPLNCMWCHNPESQDFKSEIMLRSERCISCGSCRDACKTGGIENADLCLKCGECAHLCPSGAREKVGRLMSVSEVFSEIKKDLIFYEESGGGVTFSGGEPFSQAEFLKELLQVCVKNELHTAVETSGFTSKEVLTDLAPLINLFLFDLKIIDDEKHKKYIGVSNKRILDNLTYLSSVHSNIIIRIPIIPGINDDEENINATAEFLRDLKNVNEINLLAYHNTGMDKYDRLKREYFLQKIVPPSEEEMAKTALKFQAFGFKVKIGG